MHEVSHSWKFQHIREHRQHVFYEQLLHTIQPIQRSGFTFLPNPEQVMVNELPANIRLFIIMQFNSWAGGMHVDSDLAPLSTADISDKDHLKSPKAALLTADTKLLPMFEIS
jgi:hypothetical protein